MASKPAESGLRWGLVEFWPRLVGVGGGGPSPLTLGPAYQKWVEERLKWKR